jgi:hypothetical protein
MRERFTRDDLTPLLRELARTAPRGRTYRVYLVGGSTAVLLGWRASSLDVDLYSDTEDVFRDIQGIKERLRVNVEFARPEDFVPALPGSADRHVPIEKVGSISVYHYDPYAQLLSKIVRGFDHDLRDARAFIESGLVEPGRFRELVRRIPDSAYARYPRLSRAAIERSVEEFLTGLSGGP